MLVYLRKKVCLNLSKNVLDRFPGGSERSAFISRFNPFQGLSGDF